MERTYVVQEGAKIGCTRNDGGINYLTLARLGSLYKRRYYAKCTR